MENINNEIKKKQLTIIEMSEEGVNLSNISSQYTKDELLAKMAEDPEFAYEMKEIILRLYCKKLTKMDTMIINAAIANLEASIAGACPANFSLCQFARKLLKDQRDEAFRLLADKTSLSPLKK